MFWDRNYTLERGKWVEFKGGFYRNYIYKTEKSIEIYEVKEDEKEFDFFCPIGPQPVNLDKKVVLDERASIDLRIIPSFFSLPIYYQLENILVINPKEEALFYLTSDYIIKILYSDTDKTLIERSFSPRKQAWYGDFYSGTLTRYSKGPVRFSLEEAGSDNQKVLIPVRLKNNASSELNIKRLLVSNRFLGFFDSDFGLISDEYQVVFENNDQFTINNIKKHGLAKNMKRISEPREKFSKNSLLKNKSL